MVKIRKTKPLDSPKTCIVATIGGPDIYRKAYVRKLAKEGMNVARINLAHVKDHPNLTSQSYVHIQRVVNDIREISQELQQPIGILFDICGPRIRVGDLPSPIRIRRGAKITFTTRPDCFTIDQCSVTYSDFVNEIEKDHRIFLDNGNIRLRVDEKKQERQELVCEVEATSERFIKANKGFNLPDTDVKEATLTRTDIEILQNLEKLGISDAIDFMGLSFVRRASDVRMLHDLAHDFIFYNDAVTRQKRIPLLIAKIETYQAVKTNQVGDYEILDEFVNAFDGIMVARGDLAVEKSPEDVPLIQLHLTRRGIEQGKPVIIATQMLLSMCKKGHERPTRAEANDVASAVLNYADAIMLSEETATGKNPSLCVKTMRQLALNAERSQRTEREFFRHFGTLAVARDVPLETGADQEELTKQKAIAESAVLFANNMDSPAIVVSTSSGDTAMKISKYRPSQPIIAITDIEKSANKMLLYRGVYPVLVDKKPRTFEQVVRGAKDILQVMMAGDKKLVKPRQGGKVRIPLTLGVEPGVRFSTATSGNTNTIYILEFP